MTYLGGFDAKGSDGQFIYIWQDEVLQCKESFNWLTLLQTFTNEDIRTHRNYDNS